MSVGLAVTVYCYSCVRRGRMARNNGHGMTVLLGVRHKVSTLTNHIAKVSSTNMLKDSKLFRVIIIFIFISKKNVTRVPYKIKVTITILMMK